MPAVIVPVKSASGTAARISQLSRVVLPLLIPPFTEYGDHVNQLDLRVGKILRFGGTRTLLAVDIYNALNANPVMSENPNYAAFRRPTSIMAARFAKISMQFDF